MQRAACNMQHTTYNTLRAACSVQRAAYNMQRAAYNMQHAAYNMQHTPPNTRRAACAMQRTNAIHRAAGKIKLVVSKEKTRKNGFRCIGASMHSPFFCSVPQQHTACMDHTK